MWFFFLFDVFTDVVTAVLREDDRFSSNMRSFVSTWFACHLIEDVDWLISLSSVYACDIKTGLIMHIHLIRDQESLRCLFDDDTFNNYIITLALQEHPFLNNHPAEQVELGAWYDALLQTPTVASTSTS